MWHKHNQTYLSTSLSDFVYALILNIKPSEIKLWPSNIRE